MLMRRTSDNSGTARSSEVDFKGNVSNLSEVKSILPSKMRGLSSSHVIFLFFCGIQSLLFLIIGLYFGQSQGCLTQQTFSPVKCNRSHHASFSLTSRLNLSQWLERYKAAMLLGGSADAIAYKKGHWEFNLDGLKIHKEVEELGGLENLQMSLPNWIVSDDTVMHLATAEAIVEFGSMEKRNLKKLFQILAKHYVRSMTDMDGRAPGNTCILGAAELNPSSKTGYIIPFNPRGGGCGAAMRAMCIGMYHPSEDQLDDLIAVSIESGRMTHNHPTGYLGALASALFVHYAIQDYPVQSWGARLVASLDKAWKYVEGEGRDVEENRKTWYYFENTWKNYLKLRGIEDGASMPQFPDVYDVAERDEFYKNVSFSGWGGSSGHDAPMIAYDALLGSGNNWKKLSERAFFHGGDSDSTAIIAASCFGIMYGFEGAPEGNYKNLEYKERLLGAGTNIFRLVEEHFNKF